jgi:hypothetical protein
VLFLNNLTERTNENWIGNRLWIWRSRRNGRMEHSSIFGCTKRTWWATWSSPSKHLWVPQKRESIQTHRWRGFVSLVSTHTYTHTFSLSHFLFVDWDSLTYYSSLETHCLNEMIEHNNEHKNWISLLIWQKQRRFLILEESSLIPVLEYFLNNDSLLDMSRHESLYTALLNIVRALAENDEWVFTL